VQAKPARRLEEDQSDSHGQGAERREPAAPGESRGVRTLDLPASAATL